MPDAKLDANPKKVISVLATLQRMKSDKRKFIEQNVIVLDWKQLKVFYTRNLFSFANRDFTHLPVAQSAATKRSNTIAHSEQPKIPVNRHYLLIVD